jgi:hypothetical protein
MTIAIIIGIITAGAIIYIAFLRKHVTSQSNPAAIPIPARFKMTPQRVIVMSPVSVPDSALNAIDQGIQTAIDKMPASWTGGRILSEYKVTFVAPEGYGAQGNPYITRGGIKAWGYVSGISADDPSGRSDQMVIVMPHQQDIVWSHPEWISGTAWSEAEHVLERKASIQLNDPEIFTQWVGPNDVHPHRP